MCLNSLVVKKMKFSDVFEYVLKNEIFFRLLEYLPEDAIPIWFTPDFAFIA